jgi:5,5'-dehydrodivanillate O-demethylase
MRRYWHPFLPAIQLDENPVQPVRLLGEDLVCYRDGSGEIGLVGDRCPHRAFKLEYGVPEENGLRCPYHGWLFNAGGQCTQQPLEPPTSTFKDRIKITSYPVQEMGGLLWTYMGPTPAPLLPQWDLFVRPDGFREIITHRLPCNWLQAAENRADLGHAIYLHGRLFQYALQRKGRVSDDPGTFYNGQIRVQNDRLQRGVYPKWRPVYNEFGLSKGQIDSDQSEDSLAWTVGSNPILFPYQLAFGPVPNATVRRQYELGVPVDDYNTWHIKYMCYSFPSEVGVPTQAAVPYTELPLQDEKGQAILDYIIAQDMVAWWSQGPLTDRTTEHLAASDSVVIAYRKLLREQIQRVTAGEEPINVFHDPDRAFRPELRLPNLSMADRDTVGGGYRAAVSRALAPGERPNQPRPTDPASVIRLEKRTFLATTDSFTENKDLLLELYERTEALWEQRQREQESAQLERERPRSR